MLGYLLRRILAAIPVMGVVALFVFLLLRLTPGDPAAILAGDNATPEQLERIRTSLGLNEPLYSPILHLDRQAAAWRSRRVADFECAGAANDRPARRALDLRSRCRRIILSIAGRGAARRHRGMETRHLDRPLRDGIVGDRLLGAGVRDRLCADPDLCHRPALASGAGFQQHPGRLRPVPRTPHPADRARCRSSMSR